MMKRETIPITDIYVPTKRRATLEQKRVGEIAASILDKGLQAPILVRADGARLRVCIGWRPPRRLANRPLSPSLSMHGSTKLLPARCFAVVQRGVPQPLPSFHFSATRQRMRQQSMAVANPKSLNAIGWHFFQLVA
jgi:hypothetical protein